MKRLAVMLFVFISFALFIPKSIYTMYMMASSIFMVLLLFSLLSDLWEKRYNT